NEKYEGKTCTVATLKSKRQQMQKEYSAWYELQHRTGLGYDPAMDTVNCLDHVWKDFINVNLLFVCLLCSGQVVLI
uniref:hypothetical protein n=1 Tax=Escherichia coli TaxID=562 RepID=UPI002243F52E